MNTLASSSQLHPCPSGQLTELFPGHVSTKTVEESVPQVEGLLPLLTKNDLLWLNTVIGLSKLAVSVDERSISIVVGDLPCSVSPPVYWALRGGFDVLLRCVNPLFADKSLLLLRTEVAYALGTVRYVPIPDELQKMRAIVVILRDYVFNGTPITSSRADGFDRLINTVNLANFVASLETSTV